jgi:hypothetical protein
VRFGWAPALVVLLVALVSATAVVVAVLARTTIPYELHGEVVAIDVRNRRSGGAEVWLVQLEDGRAYFTDEVVARTLEEGGTVDKDAWSREVLIAGSVPRRIGLSRASAGPVLWAGAVLVVVALTVRWSWKQRPDSRPEGPPPPPAPATTP